MEEIAPSTRSIYFQLNQAHAVLQEIKIKLSPHAYLSSHRCCFISKEKVSCLKSKPSIYLILLFVYLRRERRYIVIVCTLKISSSVKIRMLLSILISLKEYMHCNNSMFYVLFILHLPTIDIGISRLFQKMHLQLGYLSIVMFE